MKISVFGTFAQSSPNRIFGWMAAISAASLAFAPASLAAEITEVRAVGGDMLDGPPVIGVTYEVKFATDINDDPIRDIHFEAADEKHLLVVGYADRPGAENLDIAIKPPPPTNGVDDWVVGNVVQPDGGMPGGEARSWVTIRDVHGEGIDGDGSFQITIQKVPDGYKVDLSKPIFTNDSFMIWTSAEHPNGSNVIWSPDDDIKIPTFLASHEGNGVAGVPTLSEWGLLILAGSLIVLGGFRVRRQQPGGR